MSRSPSAEQILFFSDAVMAITITLLMLEIKLPEEAAKLSDGELLSALVSIWKQFLSYVISFLVIGTFWLGHHRKLHFIRRTDLRLVWLDLLFLLIIGLIPFATSLISENGGATATMLYAGIITLVELTLLALWIYAGFAGLTDLDRARQWQMARPTLLTAVVFALTIPVALVSPDVAKYCWLLLIPLSQTRHFRRDSAGPAKTG